ncbi:MAG: ROK family protein [Planctomycetaceae bacterium]
MRDEARWLPLAQAKPPFHVGIDLGGTNIKAGLVDDLGRTLAYLSEPTLAAKGPEDTAARMGRMVGLLTKRCGLPADGLVSVGLGTPGPQDLKAGIILRSGNLPGWDIFPIRDRVAAHCGRPVTYANDAGAAAYGEFWIGSGRELESMVLWTLGTGVGCGIIIDDVSLDGAHSHGSECGHIIVDAAPTARHCACGQAGHLEAYASATAVIARTREAVVGAAGSLAAAVAAGAEVTPILVAEHAAASDPLAVEILLETARWLAIGTVTLMHTIDPEGVVIGGGMNFGGEETPVGRMFIGGIRDEVAKRTFPYLAARTGIRYASLGGDAGYIGAAGLARHALS